MDERRIVSVLFCDVVGSTALAAQLDPEEWAEIIRAAFPHLIEPVERYGGTVARLMGDAILAFFGAPVAHEDDAQRAVLAGLGIVESIQALREEVRREYGLDLNVRVGINTGIVITGAFGTERTFEYTAMGDAVNLAARMEQTAAPGTIQITADTRALVYPYFIFEPLGLIEVKGKDQPVDAYRVLGRRIHLSAARSELRAPLIGREPELRLLSGAAAATLEGRGGIYALLGEAGLGKSRLLDELRDEWLRLRSSAERLSVLEDRLVSFESAVPYGLIRRRICAGLGIPEAGLSSDDIDAAVTRLGIPDDGQRRRAARTIELLFSSDSHPMRRTTAPEGTEPAPLDADEFRRELVTLIVLIWRAWLAEQGAGMYIIDDFQHADMASLEILEDLLPRVADLPLLIVLAFRPERQAAAWRVHRQLADRLAGRYVSLQLAPLDGEQTVGLIDALLIGAELPMDFRRAILDRVDGNPLFAEEIIRTLIDRGLVEQRDDDGWRIVEGADLMQVTIPTTLQSLMQERIDRLNDDVKQTLQIAAVIGRTFSTALVAAVADTPEHVDAHLAALQGAMLIRAVGLGSAREYQFQHALTWEATYQIILHRQRRRLHRRVGEALERMYADLLEDQMQLAGYQSVIAGHFDHGGEPARAVVWYRQAGSKAAVQFAHVEALRSFTRALELLTSQDVTQRFEIVLEREHVLSLRGERGAQADDLATLETLAEQLDEDRLRCEALLRQAQFAEVTGDYNRAIRTARQAIQLAEVTSSISAEALAHVSWGSALWHQGAYAESRAPLEHALALARAAMLSDVEASALRGLGVIAEAEGDLAGAYAAFEKSLELMRFRGDRRGESAALNSLGLVAYYQRSYSEARVHFDQSLRIKQEIGDRRGQSTTLNNLGVVACAQGDFGAAQVWLDQALELALATGDREGESSALEVLGAIALYVGDFGRAHELLENALRLFQAIGDQVGECEAHSYLSLLHHFQGDDASAETHALDAVRVARVVGSWSGQVRALTCLGHALLGLGRLVRAEAAYQAAVELPQDQAWHSLAMEPVAGLARVCLEAGVIDQAVRHVDAVAAFLEHDTLDGAEDPIRVYLTCWYVLREHDLSRARSVLRAGWTMLQERADRAGDAAHRRSLLDNVPSHRALRDEWKRSGL